MATEKRTPVPILWCSSEKEYAKILALLWADEASGALPFDEFTARMRVLEDAAVGRNEFPVRIKIRADELKAWCEETKNRASQKAISKFAMEQMRRRIERPEN